LLHSAVPQSGQLKTSCGLPLPAVSMTERSRAWSASTKRRSIQMLTAKAPPVRRWQSRQWQALTIKGGAVKRYRTAPQAHPPSWSIAASFPG
jgi:hypothetical protein